MAPKNSRAESGVINKNIDTETLINCKKGITIQLNLKHGSESYFNGLWQDSSSSIAKALHLHKDIDIAWNFNEFSSILLPFDNAKFLNNVSMQRQKSIHIQVSHCHVIKESDWSYVRILLVANGDMQNDYLWYPK